MQITIWTEFSRCVWGKKGASWEILLLPQCFPFQQILFWVCLFPVLVEVSQMMSTSGLCGSVS